MAEDAGSQRLDPEDVQRAARFRLALRRFHARADKIVRRHALTPRQYLLLLAIEARAGRRGHVTVGELVSALVLAQGTLSELLDRTEAAGLIVRGTAPHDRRVVHIRLSAEGRRRFAAAFRELQEDRRNLARAASLLGELEPPLPAGLTG
jgi:DNA-binding MarR family transcriptional regulator